MKHELESIKRYPIKLSDVEVALLLDAIESHLRHTHPNKYEALYLRIHEELSHLEETAVDDVFKGHS